MAITRPVSEQNACTCPDEKASNKQQQGGDRSARVPTVAERKSLRVKKNNVQMGNRPGKRGRINKLEE